MADAKTVLTKSTASGSERGVIASYIGKRLKNKQLEMIHYGLKLIKDQAQTNKPGQEARAGWDS